MELSPGQISFALEMMVTAGIGVMAETQYDHYWEIIRQVTEKQYNYLLHLCYSKKINELNQLLSDWEKMYGTKLSDKE